MPSRELCSPHAAWGHGGPLSCRKLRSSTEVYSLKLKVWMGRRELYQQRRFKASTWGTGRDPRVAWELGSTVSPRNPPRLPSRSLGLVLFIYLFIYSFTLVARVPRGRLYLGRGARSPLPEPSPRGSQRRGSGRVGGAPPGPRARGCLGLPSRLSRRISRHSQGMAATWSRASSAAARARPPRTPGAPRPPPRGLELGPRARARALV